MKKRMMFVVLFGLLLLTSCGTKLTRESFDDIGNGMTADEVIDILGKPSKTITKQTKVKELVDSEYKSYMQIVAMTDEDEFPDEYKRFYDLLSGVAHAKALIEKNETVKVFIYKYNYEDSDGKKEKLEKELYFYNNELFAY